jgi:hypothetical protein
MTGRHPPNLFPTLHTLNPVLHTVWLDNNTLTVRRNTEKYYFGEKSSFCTPSEAFVVNQEKLKSSSKTCITFNAIRVLKSKS